MGLPQEEARLFQNRIHGRGGQGVDWDSLLAAGGGPGLALGGERRLRKGPPPAK